ncbi:copper resistance system multicopper oxidase [Komagataeibacter sp. AV436]|uniref:Copper resistance system multicopper oxidase n=1 Tax=Komagataeibacter melomenusus TaxID=2766578 RepID=A0ABX2AB21_9PROT|nr:copper resistance system multicopper oxidase [Komagataeibacter melomenusus]MBV1829203.1 copper resistance system multicopper oxidase [Komagataeibacter melomenusus]NPC65458.1 copper resistance system multicopper oxidase [Komagataeibacter melomenusus]
MLIPSRNRGGLSRRRFVTGLSAGGLVAALPRPLLARTPTAGQIPPVARPRWDLRVGRTRIEIDRKVLHAPCIGGDVPGPILRWRQGDTVSINVTNTLADEETSIHWHGLRLPAAMDGVPGLSFAGIAPGKTFTYRFPITQSGTYWYHSHSGMQEAQGLYGAIVIDPPAPDPQPCARDYVILLSEWSDVSPMDMLDNLKMQDDYYVFRQRTLASLPREARAAGGTLAALKDRLAWSRMRMAATDIADVTGVIYTYLLNGHAPDMNWNAIFTPGERVRLRFINGASMTFFDIRIPGLEMLVVAADGNAVEPVPVDEFRIGVAETYDVIVQPTQARAYTIFAQSEDRTGYARGTLAPQPGMSGPIPPMDPRPVRTMVDMGMGDMKPGESMHGMAMPGHRHGSAMAGMDMADHKTQPPMSGMPMPRHEEGAMDDMDMKDMQPAPTALGGHGHGHSLPMPAAHLHKPGTMDHDAPAADMAPVLEVDDPGPPPLNVENQNIARMPTDRLASPGDGLEHNGRRVLSYSQLRATRPGTDPRPPTREIIMHLTGNMERYIWGFNGRKFSESGPIRLRRNERVRFTLINDTMMEHPIHLHGLWSELENGQGAYRPYKHTLISQPGSKLSYLVTADAPGLWAYHCHLMLHMETGMFRTVIVE